jgi:hypothetical protein
VISFCVGVFLVLLGTGSALAQTNQSSQQQGNETGNQSSGGGQQQQSQAMPPTDIVTPITNETAEGFASESDVENLTGLNFGGVGERQQGNETGNQSSGGGQQQQQQQQGNETGNQSSQNPIEQIGEAISDAFGGN